MKRAFQGPSDKPEPDEDDEDDGEYGYTGRVDADREDFHSDG